MKSANPVLLGFVFFATGCTLVGAAEQPIDCTIAHTDTRMDSCPVVRLASEFGQCLSRDELEGYACVLMDQDLEFCDGEPPMAITAMFDRSDVALNCAGGTIDHGWGRNGIPTGGVQTPGDQNAPFVRFVDDRSLSGVDIRNCTMRGTLHAGIQMTRFFGGQLGGDGVLGPDEPRPLGHHDITIEDVVVEDVQVGIYLGNYSRDIALNRIRVDGTERIALYSEAGSHRISLNDSIIANNRTREAVALDSTYDSEITDTLFVNNREGGINVYRNCGELKGSVCPVVRDTAPNNNRLTGNTFVNTGVAGIQIASRQGRNHREGWCADLDGRAGQFTDTAENNVVSDNTFVCRDGTALVVHDGPNQISGNRIVARERCVPYEISTGGLGASAAPLLEGLVFTGNEVDAERAPRLRNVGGLVADY